MRNKNNNLEEMYLISKARTTRIHNVIEKLKENGSDYYFLKSKKKNQNI